MSGASARPAHAQDVAQGLAARAIRGTSTPEQLVSSGLAGDIGQGVHGPWAAWDVVYGWADVLNAASQFLIGCCAALPLMPVLGRACMPTVCLQGPRCAWRGI
jgi:hypothetical protein